MDEIYVGLRSLILHANGKDTGREQSFFLIKKNGLISKETITKNVRLSVEQSTEVEKIPTVLFPNHAFEAIKTRNCCGNLVIRKVLRKSRFFSKLSVIQNLSPFSSPSSFKVFDWKEELTGVTCWRDLGWKGIKHYFTDSREVSLESVVCFVNVVLSHPDVDLCFPSSIIDSKDKLLQSSFEGADFVQGVPGVTTNNPPPLLLPLQKTSKRKRRMLGSDSSFTWKKVVLHTSASSIDKVFKKIHGEVQGLMAFPFVTGKLTTTETLKIGFIDLADSRQLNKADSRSIMDHNQLLKVMSRKVVELMITRTNSSGHLVVSILSRQNRKCEMETIEEVEAIAPASFATCSCDNDKMATLDLIKVMGQPKVC
jgi:hypothetical protein